MSAEAPEPGRQRPEENGSGRGWTTWLAWLPPRRTAAAVAAWAAALSVLRVLEARPPGYAHVGHARLLAETLGAPEFWRTWAVGGLILGAVLTLLIRGSGRRPGVGWWVCEPVAWGGSAGVVALLLDPVWFHGTGWLLTGGGVGVGTILAGRRLHRATEGRIWRLGPAVLACVAVLVPVAMSASGPPHWPGFSGDEPHYLLYARSLWVDGDLDLGQDYLDRDYSRFHPGDLSPHTKAGLEPESRYSTHGIGVAAWMAPWYGLVRFLDLDGAAAAATLRFAMALWLGAFVVLFHRLLSDVAGERAATLGAAVAALTGPLVFLAPHVFPDLPALTLTTAAYGTIRRRRGPLGAAVAGALVGSLPWLGVKFFSVVGAMAVVAALWLVRGGEERGRDRWAGGIALAAFCAPVALSIGAHVAFTWSLYGRLSPLALYFGSGEQAVRPPGMGEGLAGYLGDPAGILGSAVGWFLDQKVGLFLIAPHYLLAAAGAGWMWRRRRRDLISALLVLGGYGAVYAVSQERGGWSPAGRTIAAVIWTLALPLAIGLALRWRRASRSLLGHLRGALLAAGGGITALLLSQPSLLYHDYNVRHSLLLSRYGIPELPGAATGGAAPSGATSVSGGGVALRELFPLWIGVRETPGWIDFGWLLVVVAVVVLLWRAGSGSTVEGAATRAPEGSPTGGGWRAAALVWIAGTTLLLAHHLWAPVSSVERPHRYGPVSIWVSDLQPERAWGEADGVWVRGGSDAGLVLSSEDRLARVRLELSSLVTTPVWIQLGGDDELVEIGEGRPRVLLFRPRRGIRREGRWFYRLGTLVLRGASPAELGIDARDVRPLGVYLRVLEVEFEEP